MNGHQIVSLGMDITAYRVWRSRAAAIAVVAAVVFLATGQPVSAVPIFSEDFNGYASNPNFPANSNDLGGHQTIFGVPLQSEGAASNLWMAARFEYADSEPLTGDIGILRYGNGSPSGPYGNPAGRVSDDAGLVLRLDLTNFAFAQLAFDWRTFATETTDRFVAAYYVGDGLGTPNNAYDWFNDPLLGNGDMSGADPNGMANPWYLNNWTEVLRATSPNGFQQESGIVLPTGSVIYLAFWLDNGDNDLGKVDNIQIEGTLVVPEPSSMLIAVIGAALCACVAAGRRFAVPKGRVAR